MRRILLLILAFFLFPFYPVFKRFMKMGDKIRFGEKVVVVIVKQGNRKILFD